MTKNHKPGTVIETRKEDLETPAPKRRKLKGVGTRTEEPEEGARSQDQSDPQKQYSLTLNRESVQGQ